MEHSLHGYLRRCDTEILLFLLKRSVHKDTEVDLEICRLVRLVLAERGINPPM